MQTLILAGGGGYILFIVHLKKHQVVCVKK